MKCPMCGGTAYAYACEDENGKMPIKCPWCGYSEVQTNEEWFDSLTTEEKAVFMTLFSLRRANVYDETFYETAADSANKAMELTVGTKKLKAYKELLAWLKGKHKA